LVTWDPNKLDLVPYLSYGGILLTGKCITSKRELTLLNIYGLCSERKNFWNSVADSGLLSHKNLIIADNLNVIVSTGEIWGRVFPSGTFGGFFQILFSIQEVN